MPTFAFELIAQLVGVGVPVQLAQTARFEVHVEERHAVQGRHLGFGQGAYGAAGERLGLTRQEIEPKEVLRRFAGRCRRLAVPPLRLLRRGGDRERGTGGDGAGGGHAG